MSTGSVEDWLGGLGLGRYGPAFVQADIDLTVLPELSDADLMQLGVTLGHRKKLLRAIAELFKPPEPAVPSPGNEQLVPGAERRELTVMFCDLVGSTALANTLDPEELRAIIAAFQSCVTDAVERFDGFVARYMGDGVLIYFGFPHAHEDDAERAVRAGLEIFATSSRIAVPPPKQAEIRIGIATGLVVVGDVIGEGPAQEQAVVGATPNLAARLQGLAEPGSIVIPASTRRLLGGRFILRELGRHQVKGFPDPVEAWAITGLSAAMHRADPEQAGSMTDFVGREDEIELLMRLWERAQAGQGRVALVSGEAGIGKSRLVSEFRRRLETSDAAMLHFACSSYHLNTAFLPIINFFERDFELAEAETPEGKRGKLEALLTGQFGCKHEDVRFIADMLAIPPAADSHDAPLTPQKIKDEICRSVVELVGAIARRRQAAILFEDLHWADPSTLEVLDRLVEQANAAPIMLVLTHRPEFHPRWPRLEHSTQLVLGRLTRAQSGAIVATLTSGKKLPADLFEEILHKTDGIPLFLEELTKSVLESAGLIEVDDRWDYTSGTEPISIPPTLRASLTARLDRLGPVAKDIAQKAAVIGREFDHDLLTAIADCPAPQLREALERLTKAGLLFAAGHNLGARYRFKHALVQDAAYETMLKSRRAQLHTAVADVLERRPADVAGTAPETLARHLTAAARSERAIPYWLAAGQSALQRSAITEAINHFNAGITLLPDLAEHAERGRYEVLLHASLGFAWTAIRGYAAPEVQAAFARAQQLYSTNGDTALAIPVLRGFTAYHWALGNLPVARGFGTELLSIAEASRDDELLLVAHGMLAGITHHLSDFSASERHLQHLRPSFDWQKEHNIIKRFGEATPTATYVYHGYNLAWLGHPAAAYQAIEEAIEAARLTEHPLSIANAIGRAAACPVILRNPPAARALAEKGMVIAREFRFPIYIAMSTIVIGWSLALSGDAAGIAQIRQGMGVWQATGAACGLPCFFGLLSEALLTAGEVDGAIAAADEGRHWSERNAERSWDCLLFCARGDALLEAGKAEAAEADFREALSWSRVRGARWGELCAAIRLTRLLRAERRGRAARDLLASLCGWFEEAADNPVLLEARALLNDLATTCE